MGVHDRPGILSEEPLEAHYHRQKSHPPSNYKRFGIETPCRSEVHELSSALPLEGNNVATPAFIAEITRELEKNPFCTVHAAGTDQLDGHLFGVHLMTRSGARNR